MPLIHSKKPSAFKENIRTEVHAGKPVKQAVAIAYSEQRRAQHHKSHGGEIESCNPKLQGLAEGGEVQSDDDELHNMVGQEMMDSIHSKDYKKLMGGIEAMVLRCLNKDKEEI